MGYDDLTSYIPNRCVILIKLLPKNFKKKCSIRRIYALQLIEGSILRYLILNLPAIAITSEVHNR